MSRNFYFLLICLTFSLLAFSKNGKCQQQGGTAKIDVNGVWEFSTAEYMERQSPAHPYQVKYVVEKEEDLYSFAQHFGNLVKNAIFHNGTVIFYDLFARYSGRYNILPTGQPEDNVFMIVIGNGEESEIEYSESQTMDIPIFQYLIDKTDDNTVRITLERIFQDGSVTKFGAVRCVLKKVG